MDNAKCNFVMQCRSTASLIARVLGEMRTQAATYLDRDYAEGLTQEDLTGNPQVEDLTPEEVAAWENVCRQLAGTVGGAVGWIGTGAPTSESVVNVMRNDI